MVSQSSDIDRSLLAESLQNLYLTEKSNMRTVVGNLLGLQAQFNANPYYSLMLRSNDYDESVILENYVKTWSFRGTMHLVHKSDLSLHLSARNHRAWSDGWGMSAKDKPYWSDFILDAIYSGTTTRAELKIACQEAQMTDDHFASVFHGWGGLLQEMCLRGLIAYKPTNAKEFVALDPINFIDQKEARTRVVEQYFQQYGPATVQDCAYFTGYKINEVKSLLEASDLQLFEQVHNGNTYYSAQALLRDPEIPEIVLLAGFDPLFLAYKDKSRFMKPSEARKYVTNTGIIFPAILVRGSVACRWQKKGKAIIVRPYRKLHVKQRKMIISKLQDLFPHLTVVIEQDII